MRRNRNRNKYRHTRQDNCQLDYVIINLIFALKIHVKALLRVMALLSNVQEQINQLWECNTDLGNNSSFEFVIESNCGRDKGLLRERYLTVRPSVFIFYIYICNGRHLFRVCNKQRGDASLNLLQWRSRTKWRVYNSCKSVEGWRPDVNSHWWWE